MNKDRSWTVGRQLVAAFAVPLFILVGIGAYSYEVTQRLLVATSERAHTCQVLTNLSEVLAAFQDVETGERGFVITGLDEYLEPYTKGKEDLGPKLEELRELTSDNPRQQQRIAALRPLIQAEMAALDAAIGKRKQEGLDAAVRAVVEGSGKRAMAEIRGVVASMVTEEEQLLEARTAAIDDVVRRFARSFVGACLLAFVVVTFVVTIIVRMLNARIGRAAQRMRNASRELHTAAMQQARGAEEQVSASMQVTTTIRELSVTAKQIAESAHQVTDVATRTSDATRGGDSKVQSAREAIEATREQVDEVVAHMLGLGRKSQEIGGIVDMVGELAEQTNILAINATIEAIGAGDAGRRFRVVADEIRKLADRVAASARSIRTLIEQVRAAATTTVMATEDGAKAVDASTQRFVDVGTSFAQIREYVGGTAAAAREIEMSTRQQTTAMEQVSHAMGGVSDTAREVATSAEQTLRTATELASVAEGLLRLVQRDEEPRKVAPAAG